jgi:UDP-N-acetyl-D-mannosaminuronic acid dehydrogenase
MSGEFDVCVVGGCGHVGLPFGMALAGEGQKVALYDINQAAIDMVNSAKLPFLENNAEALLEKVVKSNNLVATNDA